MRYQISGKQIDIGEALQTHVKAELGEVEADRAMFGCTLGTGHVGGGGEFGAMPLSVVEGQAMAFEAELTVVTWDIK